jgi:hypothetical protein
MWWLFLYTDDKGKDEILSDGSRHDAQDETCPISYTDSQFTKS